MNENAEKIKPTTSWMSEKYDEMNAKLFGYALGYCNFKIFNGGSKTLGRFRMEGYGLKANKYDGRMFKEDYYGDREYIDEQNFYDLCYPIIELNGNYSGTETALLSTLVHEMCHYYTYMKGICPKQAHGREFKQIAAYVSSMSEGIFTIQRLASAEEMNEYELDDKIKQKDEQRLNNKKSKTVALFVYKNNEIQMSLLNNSNQDLINKIVSHNTTTQNTQQILSSNDINLINKLYEIGYKKVFRTYRYWNLSPRVIEILGGQNFIQNYDYKTLFNNNVEKEEEQKPNEKRIFQIKTSKGILQLDANNEMELYNNLKIKFPNMSDETIQKIMNNNSNYKTITENKKLINKIVESVMNKIQKKSNKNNIINISSNFDLGNMSPIE